MRTIQRQGFFLFFLLLIMSGCKGTAYNYVPEAGEMQTGSGLLSGEDGVFKIYEIEKTEKPEE